MHSIFSSVQVQVGLATVSVVAFLSYLTKQGRRRTETQAKTTGLVHLKHDFYFGSLGFFHRPAYFLADIIEAACDSMITFKIRSNTIIILRGLAGRDAFYSKGLDFLSGYKLLNPLLVDVMPLTEISGDESWASFFTKFVRSEVLQRLYPQMVKDVTTILSKLGEQGTINLFDHLDQTIFALAVRLGSCVEFCEDPKKTKRLRQVFKDLEAGSSPRSVLFPWFPTPARIRRTLAGARMYYMITEVTRERKRHDRREDDTLQVLIDGNYSPTEITRFIATLLFAATSNTGNTLGWVFVYLEKHSDVKDQVVQEIQKLSQNPQIYMEDFEQATPSIEPCINETLRLVLNGTFLRRNIGSELNVGGVRIHHGTYLMYPTTDLHFHPRFFPDPHRFDPMRFDPEVAEERKKAGITFLAWGAARHVCTGKRSAILMMKIVLVQLFIDFDFQLVDIEGEPMKEIPPPAYDILFKVCPPGRKDRVFLKYQKR